MGFLVLSREVDEDIIVQVPPSAEATMITVRIFRVAYGKVRIGTKSSNPLASIDRKEVADAKAYEKMAKV